MFQVLYQPQLIQKAQKLNVSAPQRRVYIARKEELTQLYDLVMVGLQGDKGYTVLLEGTSGSGKSFLGMT